ncbi:MAG TPA: methyltransferase domain-containing protein [Casimicrobiaceae bacterium]
MHEPAPPEREPSQPEGKAAAAPPIREQHYRDKIPHRGRGVGDLDRRVGGVFGEIDERLGRRDVVRILELGCGYGTALLELRARYGRRVELHGLNRRPGDGNPEILLRNAAERGLTGASVAANVPWPAIAYADVAGGLPFADDAFDLVYSQVAWLYFGNKVGVLRDVMRVLRPDGVARIDADEVRSDLPPEYRRLVEIWESGRLLPLGDYVRRYGMTLAPAAEGEYLRFGKSAGFGEDLTPVLEIDLSTLHVHWDGIKCVYRCGS